MTDKPQRVEIYLGNEIKKNSFFYPSSKIEETFMQKLRAEGIRQPLIVGSACGTYDYAVENLDKTQAARLVSAINTLEGIAAKSRDWLP